MALRRSVLVISYPYYLRPWIIYGAIIPKGVNQEYFGDRSFISAARKFWNLFLSSIDPYFKAT